MISPCQTLVDGRRPQQYSVARRYFLLLVFCLAQFLDAFNNSALFSAIPSLVRDLGFTESESTWIISAFQLTFASFLLIVSPFLSPVWSTRFLTEQQSGRISDVYDPSESFRSQVCLHRLTVPPEYAFIAGVSILGFVSIGAGFVRQKIVLIVLRALCGIGTSWACCLLPRTAPYLLRFGSRLLDNSVGFDAPRECLSRIRRASSYVTLTCSRVY